MAVISQRSYLWMLVLSSCVSRLVGTDCGTECGLCVERLQGTPASFSTLTCLLKCESGLESQRLHMCQDLLFEGEDSLSLDADPLQQQEVVAGTPDDEAAPRPEHQILKKYGGFMKRYGGFMSRRSSSQQRTGSDLGNQDEEENIYLGILKIISAAKDGRKSESDGEEEVKRYEGSVQHTDGGVASGNLLEGVLSRGLKKRYGGFMRRVGRPEWLVSGSKSGGALKRACENGSGLQKRYGGFMD